MSAQSKTVIDLRPAAAPKSDQLNADDLIAGPRTITIREVRKYDRTEQPVSIFFNGDEGKPWKPCKGALRVLMAAWGADGAQFVGRSVTLYNEPTVTWAGKEVGGIRVSHLSHIDRDMKIPVTVAKGKKKMTTVRPLRIDIDAGTDDQFDGPTLDEAQTLARAAADKGTAAFGKWWNTDEGKACRAHARPIMGELQERAGKADAAATAGEDEDPFADDDAPPEPESPPGTDPAPAAAPTREPEPVAAFNAAEHAPDKVANQWQRHVNAHTDPAALIESWNAVQQDEAFAALDGATQSKMRFAVNRAVEKFEGA